jgi:preprotein translocase subunit SecA
MIVSLLKKIIGSRNDREIKRVSKYLRAINGLEAEYTQLSDQALREKTQVFKQRLTHGETLEIILPEAFAAVREAARRTLGLRHFDVQMMGGAILHEGKIAEMGTGEGKTLVATLPVYLNALEGKGVHVVTVNDYLANRDGNWMRPVYEKLGMTVGVVLSGQDRDTKKQAYAADITYGTNNEYGFDYLRDNMALRLEDKVQRGSHYAIVDEVDSILIDEARTPLIISGMAENSSLLYTRVNMLIPKLREGKMPEASRELPMLAAGKIPHVDGDYVIDEKHRQVELTEQGHQKIEQLLVREGLLQAEDSLYAATNLSLLHHVHSALRAHSLYHRDVEYIVEEDKVVLIDEHTGRKMEGRRLSEGLHQAIEAKEGVAIQSESHTLASTTFQNYFRLYKKLSGMTGTADTEAPEFLQIYGLQVVVIPPNVPSKRKDLNDLIYLSKEDKYEAIIVDIKQCLSKQAPVLVGTSSVETSEEMSRRLTKAGIEHRVLNAKFHAKEAEIIAQAGKPGTVTIATNMAGRGTDIVLGGNWAAEVAELGQAPDSAIARIKADWQVRHDQVIASGGLHILGTERHESRRIDNQLRGRAGRQGDPGVSRFYLSLEDDLMRIFASDRIKNMMQMMGMQRGEAIEHKMVSNSIEKAQRKVEGRNFDIRKQLLEFDDVANDQRQVIYQQRRDILEAENIQDIIQAIRQDVINEMISAYIPPQSLEEQWDIAGLEAILEMEYGISLPVSQWLKQDEQCTEKDIREKIVSALAEAYDRKCEQVSAMSVNMRQVEKDVMLQILDQQWKEHLANMDYLRQGIHLRAYAQKNPKQEYKRESFGMFENLLGQIKNEVVRVLSRIQISRSDEMEELERKRREEQEKIQLHHAQLSAMGEEIPDNEKQEAAPVPFVREGKKVGRNEACPCGSGKKYKQCHGKVV